jgi:hypothetical protein
MKAAICHEHSPRHKRGLLARKEEDGPAGCNHTKRATVSFFRFETSDEKRLDLSRQARVENKRGDTRRTDSPQRRGNVSRARTDLAISAGSAGRWRIEVSPIRKKTRLFLSLPSMFVPSLSWQNNHF